MKFKIRLGPPGPESAVIDFYRGRGRDHRGRTLDEILAMSDWELEDTHDFIQWLFPIRTRGVAGPVATDADIAAFRGDPALRAAMRRSLRRMLIFYGFRINEETEAAAAVGPAVNISSRRAVWLRPENHNFKRISRILRSLCLMGLEDPARAFFLALSDIHRVHASVIGESFGFWKLALSGSEPTSPDDPA